MVSILINLNSITVSLDLHYLLVLFCFSQETLLVHKDLILTEGLNELIVDLRIEGWAFHANYFYFTCKMNSRLLVSPSSWWGRLGVFVSMLNFYLEYKSLYHQRIVSISFKPFWVQIMFAWNSFAFVLF